MFPHCWPYARGIHWILIDSEYIASAMRGFDIALLFAWTSCWKCKQAVEVLRRRNAHLTLLCYSEFIFQIICRLYLHPCYFQSEMLYTIFQHTTIFCMRKLWPFNPKNINGAGCCNCKQFRLIVTKSQQNNMPIKHVYLRWHTMCNPICGPV